MVSRCAKFAENLRRNKDGTRQISARGWAAGQSRELKASKFKPILFFHPQVLREFAGLVAGSEADFELGRDAPVGLTFKKK